MRFLRIYLRGYFSCEGHLNRHFFKTFTSCFFIWSLWPLSPAWAVVSPQRGAATPAAKSSASPVSLDFVRLEHDGQTVVVRGGEELSVIAGDRITLLEAVLKNGQKAQTINFVGFSPPAADGVASSENDRGRPINTGTDLLRDFAVKGAPPKTFVVKTSTGSRFFGEIKIRVVDPQVNFVVMLVNDIPRVMRPGELSTIAPTDTVKLSRIEANAPAEGIDFRIGPATGTKQANYEMTFVRRGRVIARIPLRVEEAAP